MGTIWRDDTWEDIGGGTEITYYLDEDSGERVGLVERHLCVDGRLSRGSVPFENSPALINGARWRVDQAEPLTISPSIQCQACPHHGWIRDGRWVDA